MKISDKAPGAVPVEWREYRYVSDDESNNFVGNGLFNKIINKITPIIPTSGGAISENCKLWTPDGKLFHALSYKGDLNGWRKQIEKGAANLGLITGKIIDNKLILTTGENYNIEDCKIEFY
ncbi:hypothetical protein [Providencia stuartii]|uniref:hypothetical protein n=1 Tax=Providencia stuartii TaxID=588 RepID=UPI00073CA250|nr:hypothetical protein [Providencia stuartii]SST06362.1 Uncharacterised protein [Acinetobacter baumannii]KSX90565.1 hypothetical protein APT95_20835 [Providencia stuartii]MCX3070304.1 hypothetical protein [Providencia stuartii]MDT2017046.1 hypothetical protein [Providencia stuartii]MDT2083206.1 hypothetical protein [Providencia stuartii]